MRIDLPCFLFATRHSLRLSLLHHLEHRHHQILAAFLERHLDLLPDLERLIRRAHDVREHAQAFVQLDEGHVVGHALRPIGMIAAVHDDVGEQLAAARQLAPLVAGRQAVGADRRGRIAPLLAVRALLRHQLVGAAAVPERLVDLADRGLDRLRRGGGRWWLSGSWSWSENGLLSENHCAGGIERHAAAGDEADFRVLHLPGPALAANLAHAFDHVQPALHVGFRQVAAGGVDRKLAAEPDALAALHKGPGLALLQKPACSSQNSTATVKLS